MSVLICGAGPTGLVTALVLTANGVPCRVIEKHTGPRASSRALGLQARSMEILSGLGVADEIARVSYRLTGAAIMRGTKKLTQMDWIPPSSPYPHTYVLPQSGLERILRTHVSQQGVEVEWDTELVEAEHGGSGVNAHLADGSTVTTQWLIGADGARSRVRDSIGIPFHQDSTGETYYLADAALDLPVDIGDSAMWLGPQGPLMLMRMPGDSRTWRVFIDVSDRSETDLPPMTQEMLARLLTERGPQGTEVVSMDWTSIFRTRIGLAARYRDGNVFIAGDAAHIFPPFGGQGMNLGIQDAMNLGWRLSSVVARGSDARLLAAYEKERRVVAEATIRDVNARRKVFALRNPLARAARDALLRIGGRSERARRRASLQNSQLQTTYRDAVDHSAGGPGPRPGDRAPDAPFLNSTLHQLLGPDHVTLVHFSPSASRSRVDRSAGAYEVTVASEGHEKLRETYGVNGNRECFVIVRPDGHIEHRGSQRSTVESVIPLLVGNRKESM